MKLLKNNRGALRLRPLCVAMLAAMPLVSVQAQETPPSVLVTGRALTADQQLQQDGSAASGYAAKTLSSVGPLGAKDTLDTPFSVFVVPKDLIENLQASSVDDIFAADPFVQPFAVGARGDGTNISIRGFGNPVQMQDGFRAGNVGITNTEDKERVEILNGPTGFLYGQNAPGGTVNFVFKRPTATAYSSITVGDAGGSSAYVHGDFGGPIGDGRIGYRLNIVGQGGETAVDGQHLNRGLISGAMDFHLGDGLLLQADVSYSYYKIESQAVFWGVAPGLQYQKPPSASKNWGEPFSYSRSETMQSGLKLTWAINDALTSRTGLRYVYQRNDDIFVNDTIGAGNTYTQFIGKTPGREYPTVAAYQFFDWRFKTGDVKHKLTFGFSGDTQQTYFPKNFFGVGNSPGNFSLASPMYIPEPSFGNSGTGGRGNSETDTNENVMLGDEMVFNPSWSALVGVNRSSIISNSYNYATDGSEASHYHESHYAPTASLIYKPMPSLSTYVTYTQGLENGSSAPANATNAGQIMPPSVDKEYEIGMKADMAGMLATVALFDIDHAYNFLSNNADGSVTFVQAGREKHKGVELGLSGKPAPQLTVFGGITLLDPEVTNDPNLDGKRPQNVADHVAKVYAEYALPDGVVLTGAVQAFGNSWADSTNTQRLPGYAIGNLGVRYALNVSGRPVTLRLNVNNFTNKRYWATANYIGEPLSVAFSAETHF